MIVWWRYVLFVFVVYIPGLSSSYVDYYWGEEMCNKPIFLGEQTFGGYFRFYTSTNTLSKYSCSTMIKIKSPFVSALKFQSFSDRDCDMSMRIEYSSGSREYSFCDFPKNEIEIPRSYFVKLSITRTDPPGWYRFASLHFVLYAYLSSNVCDGSSSRCMNGRCVYNDLFCDEDFNFCNDDTPRNCNTDLTGDEDEDEDDSSSVALVSHVAPIALLIVLCIVFLLFVYFCCCRLGRNRGAARNRANGGSPTPTARDVFTIPTSQQDPDEIDYVIDYRKFEEPPPYDSLEMTPPSTSRSAHAHAYGDADGDLGPTERSDPLTVLSGATNYFPESDETRVINDTGYISGAATAGVRNEGFEDELPSYEEVLSDEGRFNV